MRFVEDRFNLDNVSDLTIASSHVTLVWRFSVDSARFPSDRFIERRTAFERPTHILCNPLHLSRIEVICIDCTRPF